MRSSHPFSNLLLYFPLQPNSYMPPYIFTTTFLIDIISLPFPRLYGHRRREIDIPSAGNPPYVDGAGKPPWRRGRDGRCRRRRMRARDRTSPTSGSLRARGWGDVWGRGDEVASSVGGEMRDRLKRYFCVLTLIYEVGVQMSTRLELP